MSKCAANYKNLNRIKSYSEQGYATVQWAKQVCMNDEWLRQQVEQLKYLSPPAVRKRFAPILLNQDYSYGYMISNGDKVIFSNSISDEINVDFQNMNLVDENKSDCSFETYVDNYGTHIRAVVPMEEVQSTDFTVRNHQGGGTNSYWYVGFDKNKSYQIRPDWIKDEFDHEIPAICRAQTITIPAGLIGKLVSVDLQIQNNGTTVSNWGSPLYVQIFRTELKHVEKTEWNKKLKKSESHDPKQYEDIYWPIGHPHNALATAKYQPSKTNPSWQNFLFDKAIDVGNANSDEHYAIVISSPLSHWEHCPRIGGWGRNCAKAKDMSGDAFLSENNGRSWIRYGRNDDKVKDYKMGQLTPSDFAYQCHIDTFTSGRHTSTDYYLYLKPILANPIKSLKISGEYTGETVADNEDDKFLDFEFSTTGQDEDWTSIRSGEWKHLTETSQILFIRAKMKTLSGSKTPSIENMSIDLKTELPKEMYVRTHFYNPKLSPMIGANLWGRVFAPFELNPNDTGINASVEIIPDRLVTEHFTIISVSDLSDYIELLDSEGNPILDSESVIGVGIDDDDRARYLFDNPTVIESLKNYNVYVKPYTTTIDNKVFTYYLSFDGGLENEGTDDEKQIISGLKLNNSPAYPIQECLLQPSGGDEVVSFGEWYDYIVDYDEDIINLDKTILTNIPSGALGISYNPVFLQNLTLEEVGQSIDEETGLISEGLILDYFKQEFIIDETNVETRRVSLRCAPVDPIKQVIINKDSDNEKELYEDIDFNVDYDSKELVFPIVNNDNKSSVLQVNDTLEVVYTPNLEDTGISIGYRAIRNDTNHQCTIKPNYIEYKV